jgi:hypothetical protein
MKPVTVLIVMMQTSKKIKVVPSGGLHGNYLILELNGTIIMNSNSNFKNTVAPFQIK